MFNLIFFIKKIPKKSISHFKKNITVWGRKNYREFTWRSSTTDYQILVAEILLQRTKAKQVESTYLEFLDEYPNFDALNKAEITEIEKQLYPLGLFKERAMRLKQLSAIITKDYDNNIPTDLLILKKLPGIGEYVARAFLCFGKNKRIAIIDANVVRLYKRYFGIKTKSELRRNKTFIELVDSILPNKAKEFNYAILDFTNKICKPRIPDCNNCPLVKYCKQNI